MRVRHHEPKWNFQRILMAEEPINIYQFCDYSLVFGADAAEEIRTRYRIIGNLVGCLPQATTQAAFSGLPLALLAEEVELLVSKGAARVIKMTAETVAAAATEGVQRAFENLEEETYLGQVEEHREGRKKEIELMMNDGVSRKRKTKGRCQTKRANIEKDRGSIIRDAIAKIKDISRERALVQSFMESPFSTLPSSHTQTLYQIGSPRLQQCRKLAFLDMWHRGFFLTDGAKFGADFLTYPGDPIRYHAQNVVICFESREELKRMCKKVSESDLVGYSRLGTAVNKTVLFAYVVLDKNRREVIKYLSPQWTGKKT